MTKNIRSIKDPVCGTTIKPKAVEARSEYQGTTYYFCSAMCKQQFEEQPKRFLPREVA